ncbi:MAG: hypothetical protein AAGF48_13820 [Pseudomonadota bacterium]
MTNSLFGVLAAFSALFFVPATAQDSQPPTPLQPNASNIPSSLAKALQKFQDEQHFQRLRDERIQLLEAIPKARARVQALQQQLADQDAMIIEIRSKIRSSENDIESDALFELRDQLRSVKAAKNAEMLRIESSNKISEELLASVRIQNEKIASINLDLKNNKNELELLISALDEADGEYQRSQRPLRVKRLEAVRLVEVLEKEFEALQTEELLNQLSKARRDLISIEAEARSADLVEAEISLDSLQRQRERIEEDERQLRGDLTAERVRADSLQANFREVSEREGRFVGTLATINAEIERLTQAVERQIAIDARSSGDPEQLKAELEHLLSSRNSLEQNLKRATEELQVSILRQTRVENDINDLFIPRSAENSFKLWMSFAFALLVGLVIWKFFQITHADESVRRVVFSAEAGIQFVTLFSLVIAIILFGITGILEGKELAALLGGISGYILGRSTPALKENIPRSAAPTVPTTPAPEAES